MLHLETITFYISYFRNNPNPYLGLNKRAPPETRRGGR